MGGTASPRPSLELTVLLATAATVLRRGLPSIAALNALPSLPAFAVLIVTGDSAREPALGDLVALPLSLVLLVFAQGATIAGVHRLLRGEAFALRASALQAWQRMPILLGAAFLAGILILLGLAAWIVPGLMALTLLYLTLPACLLERTGMVESLERSGELTSGYRWPLLGLFVLILLPVVGLGAAAGGLGLPESAAMQVLAEEAGTMLLGALAAVTATVAYERLRRIQDVPAPAPAPSERANRKT